MTYSLASLPLASRNFITSALSTGQNQKRCFRIALAYSLAKQLPLPSQEVTDPKMHYLQNEATPVLRSLSCLNEIIPFDTKETRELVAAFYTNRVAAAYPRSVPLAMNPQTAIVDFFGLTTHFSNDVLQTIHQESAQICRLVSGFCDMLNAINTKKAQQEILRQQAQEEEGSHVVL